LQCTSGELLGIPASIPTIMTILLTGSTGFLGTWIARELQSRKLQWRPLSVRLHQIRPADLEGVGTVIHCAGQVPGGGGRSDEAYAEINIAGTNHLLRQCEQAGVKRFVYISSMGVKFPSLYAQSKLAAEENIKRSQLEWLVLRPAHVYGPNKHFGKLFDTLRRKKYRFVLGLGRSPIHIVYVKDCAAAIVDAALSSRTGETINIIAPEISELEYYRVLRKVTGASFLILPMPLFWARKRKGKLAVDIRTEGLRIAGMTDWEFAATPLDTGMKQTYASTSSR
jgi:nucleoside-diphosphate-sugar epimerase